MNGGRSPEGDHGQTSGSTPDEGSVARDRDAGAEYLDRLAAYRSAAEMILAASFPDRDKVLAFARLRDCIATEPEHRSELQRELYEVARDFLGCVQVDPPGTLLRDADAFLARQDAEQRLWLAAFGARLEGREDHYQAERFTLVLAEAHRVAIGGDAS